MCINMIKYRSLEFVVLIITSLWNLSGALTAVLPILLYDCYIIEGQDSSEYNRLHFEYLQDPQLEICEYDDSDTTTGWFRPCGHVFTWSIYVF